MAGGSKVTTTEPWEKQQEYLTKGFERAEGLYGQGMPAYYPGPTLAGFDPEQRRAQASSCHTSFIMAKSCLLNAS